MPSAWVLMIPLTLVGAGFYFLGDREVAHAGRLESSLIVDAEMTGDVYERSVHQAEATETDGQEADELRDRHRDRDLEDAGHGAQ